MRNNLLLDTLGTVRTRDQTATMRAAGMSSPALASTARADAWAE
jgi:hypothetical protein